MGRNPGLWIFCFIALCPGLLLTSPVAGQSSVRELGKLLSHCTDQHGHSVAAGKSFQAYALGEGELEWLEYVYDGIRVSLKQSSPVPDLYRELIKDDQALTVGVRAKHVMRAQRNAHNLAAIKRIQAREGAHATERRKALSAQAKTEEAIRETRRILELQERLDDIRRAALEGLR